MLTYILSVNVWWRNILIPVGGNQWEARLCYDGYDWCSLRDIFEIGLVMFRCWRRLDFYEGMNMFSETKGVYDLLWVAEMKQVPVFMKNF